MTIFILDYKIYALVINVVISIFIGSSQHIKSYVTYILCIYVLKYILKYL